jgi:hypothetical protein
MASTIDSTKPISGNPTTQSVRDNFAAAKSEIEALQVLTADATTVVKGVSRLATVGETTAGALATVATTPAGVAAAIAASSSAVPDASETVKGIMEIATNAEVNAGFDSTRAVVTTALTAWNGSVNITKTGIVATGTWQATPIAAAYLPAASLTASGIVELATTAETTTGSDATRATTPAGVAAAIAAFPDASETVKGKVELATTAEAAAGSDTSRAVTAAGVASAIATAVPAATETVSGKVELATTAEAAAGSDTTRAVTAAGVASAISSAFPAASTTVAGKVELATTAEVDTGTDTTRAVTVAALQATTLLLQGVAKVVNITGTTYTPTQSQSGTVFYCSNGSNLAVTLDAALSVGTQFSFVRGGDTMAFDSASDSINGSTASQSLGASWDRVFVVKVASGNWSATIAA